MSTDVRRIHRLLRILTLIQGSSSWSPERLAIEIGCSKRTIFRDLNILERAGIPYFFDDEQRGYSVRRDFFMPAIDLTLDESLALLALTEHIGAQEQIPLTRAASRAMAKIRATLPAPIRSELEAIEKHLAVSLARSGPVSGYDDVYQTVREAIRRRVALECRYESVSHGQPTRAPARKNARARDRFRFHPYALVFNQRAWYIVGYHTARREVRTLKLNRFTHCALTREPWTMPPDFSLDDHLGNAWRMIRGRKRYAVELTFDAAFAETIADTHWHRTQEIDWHPDGSITFRCTVDGLDEIVWWVLSMGPHCRVQRPQALAKRVKELAQQTAQHYRMPRATVKPTP